MVEVIAIIEEEGTGDRWEESLKVDSLKTAKEDVEKWVKGFNNTLRKGEKARKLIGIKEEEEDGEEYERYDPKAGLGIEFKNNRGERLITILEGSRRVVPRITSWAGVSIGAVHYYAELETRSLEVRNLDHNKVYSMSGPNYPKEAEGFTHQVKKTAEADILRFSVFDGGERKVHVKKGEKTELLSTREEAKRLCKRDFRRYFGEGWKLDDWRHQLD
jgi:hypothetical protein